MQQVTQALGYAHDLVDTLTDLERDWVQLTMEERRRRGYEATVTAARVTALVATLTNADAPSPRGG